MTYDVMTYDVMTYDNMTYKVNKTWVFSVKLYFQTKSFWAGL